MDHVLVHHFRSLISFGVLHCHYLIYPGSYLKYVGKVLMSWSIKKIWKKINRRFSNENDVKSY